MLVYLLPVQAKFRLTMYCHSKSLTALFTLRGDFTLWDAEPQYQFAPVGPALYQAQVKFSTPGKVYEFKIADADFSEGYNCGYSDAQPAGAKPNTRPASYRRL